MMKKKILILNLSLLFLVSTTGLPVTYHLCQMMQEKSLNECEMCALVEEEVVTSCCVEESFDYPVSISSDNPVCCQSEFVYNKVEDQFVNNKSDINFYSIFNLVHPVVLISSQSGFYPVESFYTDSSPPFLIDSEIHITNSALLI